MDIIVHHTNLQAGQNITSEVILCSRIWNSILTEEELAGANLFFNLGEFGKKFFRVEGIWVILILVVIDIVFLNYLVALFGLYNMSTCLIF